MHVQQPHLYQIPLATFNRSDGMWSYVESSTRQSTSTSQTRQRSSPWQPGTEWSSSQTELQHQLTWGSEWAVRRGGRRWSAWPLACRLWSVAVFRWNQVSQNLERSCHVSIKFNSVHRPRQHASVSMILASTLHICCYICAWFKLNAFQFFTK